MKLLVTGATGLIGKALIKELIDSDFEVYALTRDFAKANKLFPQKVNLVLGDLSKGPIHKLPQIDGVIHLMGETIKGLRWSSQKKELIKSSRIVSSANLSKSIPYELSFFIGSSAIGFYGDRGEEILNENSTKGQGFLSDLCLDWEKEQNLLSSQRTLQLRTGLVLSNNGGAWPLLRKIFSYHMGSCLGSGLQWWSWIHIQDVVGIILYLIKNDSIKGPINVVSPHPARNNEFTSLVAQKLHSKLILPAPPASLLKLVMGSASELLLGSQNVHSLYLSEYHFQYSKLEKAIDSLIK